MMQQNDCETCIHDGEYYCAKNTPCHTCFKNIANGGGLSGYEAETLASEDIKRHL